MADEKVKIEVEVDAEPSLAGLRQIKKELKELAVTDPKFAEKQQQLDDYADALKAAKTGAGNFADVLGALPGPLGSIGGQLSGTITTLKQFSALKLNNLQSSFTELGKDVVDIGKGFANLTGITKVYEVATAASSKALQFFGVASNTANTASKALGATLATLTAATGLIAIVALVDLLSNAWDNYSKKAERAEEAQKKLNESIIKGAKAALDAESASVKQTGDLLLAEARARGANAEEIYKIEQSNRKLLLASQQRYYNELKNKDSDEAIAALANIKSTQNEIKIAEANYQAERLQKNKESSNKITQQNEQELKQIAKDKEDARISLLGEEAKEIATIERNYKTKIDLAKKHGQDTKVLEQALANEIKKIKDKYRKQDADDMKNGLIADLQAIIDTNKENFEKAKLQLDLQKAQGLIDEETYQSKLYDIRVKYHNSDTDLINAQIDKLNFLSEKKKEDAENAKEYSDKQKEYNKVIAESWINLGQTTADTFLKLGGLFEEGSAAAKAFGIASVLIGAATSIAQINFRFAEGISDARKAITKGNAIAIEGIGMLGNPITAGIGAAMIASGGSAASAGSALLGKLQINKGLQIAGVVATSAAQIAAITSAKGKSGGAATAGGGNLGAGGASSPPPAYGGAPAAMVAPQIQTTSGINPSSQIAQTIAMGQQRPIQTYVVGSQISSQQALDRRTNVAATFSGG